MGNSKKDKIALLTAIRAGKISPNDLQKTPIIVSDPQRIWEAILISTAQEEAGVPCSVVYVGEAENLLKQSESELARLNEQYSEKDQ